MTPVQLFQREHGAEWARNVQSRSFDAAFIFVNAEIFEKIRGLTDEQIAQHGPIILADLRGVLKHEAALIGLSLIKPDISSDLPDATYPNPEDEVEEQADKQDQQTSGSISEWFAPPPPEPIPIATKPKQKRKRRKRRKIK